MKKIRCLKVAVLCVMISMASACELNAAVQSEVNSASESGAHIESNITSSDEVSGESAASSADGATSESSLSAEEETDHAPVMVYSENGFAEINTDIMDTEGDLLFAAKDNSSGAWGYINTSGEWVIQPQYSEAYNFSCGYAAVVGADGKACFIDREGNKALDDYDGIYNWGGFNGFNHGYARVYKDGKYLIIDTEGNVVNSAKDELYHENDNYSEWRLHDAISEDWYNYLGGSTYRRDEIIDTGYCYVNTMATSDTPLWDNGNRIYSYQGDYINIGIFANNTSNYYNSVSGKYSIYNKKHELLVSLGTPVNMEEIYLLDTAFVIEEDGNSQFTVYAFDNTELNKFTANSIEVISSDMLLLKNNVGNYSIIGIDGTEYLPYAIGREPLTTDHSSLAITIEGKKYIVFHNPNETSDSGQKPTYEYFRIEDKKLVEMDEKYKLYLPYRQSIDGNTVILEKDGYVMSRSSLMELTRDDNGSEYMADIYPPIPVPEYSDSINAQFCLENNLYIVDVDGSRHIGHIEY